MSDLETGLQRVLHSVEVMGENKILGGKVNVKWDDVIGTIAGDDTVLLICADLQKALEVEARLRKLLD